MMKQGRKNIILKMGRRDKDLRLLREARGKGKSKEEWKNGKWKKSSERERKK